MTKYSEQFKLSVVQRYLSEPHGFRAVANEFAVGVAMVKRWVRFYRAHGLEGLSAKSPTHYDVEFKLNVLRHMWDNRLSCAQAAAVFNVRGQCNVANWQRKYRAGGTGALLPASAQMPRKLPEQAPVPPEVPPDDPRSREQLLEQIQDLQMEVAYLKKLRALIQSQQAKPAPRKKRKS